MNEFKIHKDRLFPKLNGVNLQSLKINIDCVSFVTPPNDAKRIADIAIKHIKKYKSSMKDVTIVDATACVGGDTITLCSTFGKVIGIEIDVSRYENLVHNIQQYKFLNVELLNGDSTTIIPKLPNIDIITIDVPWGGKDYKFKQNLRLNFGNYSIEQFILNCFDKQITICQPKLFISKMPKNYDIEHLYTILSPDFDITLYELKKMNIITIEKKQTQQNNANILNVQQIVKKIVNDAFQNVLNNLANICIKNNTDKYSCDIDNQTFDQTVDQTVDQQFDQPWDSTEDFCLSTPHKKTNLLN